MAIPVLVRRTAARLTSVSVVAGATLYTTATVALAAPKDTNKYNPLKDVNPGLGPLEPVIGDKIGVVLSLIWALAITGCIIYLIRGGFMLARASARRTPDGFGHAAFDLGLPLAALVVCSILPFIVNAVQA